jgi:hypothetical protein
MTPFLHTSGPSRGGDRDLADHRDAGQGSERTRRLRAALDGASRGRPLRRRRTARAHRRAWRRALPSPSAVAVTVSAPFRALDLSPQLERLACRASLPLTPPPMPLTATFSRGRTLPAGSSSAGRLHRCQRGVRVAVPQRDPAAPVTNWRRGSSSLTSSSRRGPVLLRNEGAHRCLLSGSLPFSGP